MEYDYKNQIVQSRTGNVGSSDAKMLQNVAELGYVPNSAHKRLAVVKGLIENPDFTNPAMRFGDYIENEVYNHLVASDSRWQSNPCIQSVKYARKNVGCLTHVDYLLVDDEKKVITVGECKATRLDFNQTRNEYLWQLYHHYLLATEHANNIGKGDYKVRLLLCHYYTDGLDLEQDNEFDTDRLTVKPVVLHKNVPYQLGKAMDIVDAFLETFDEYYEDEVDYSLLPANVQKQLDVMKNTLAEIKRMENEISDFKRKLYDFFVSHGVKKIQSDAFSVTLVEPTESVAVDYKQLFVQEIESKKPYVARKLKERYKKVTKRNGYVTIRTNDDSKQ